LAEDEIQMMKRELDIKNMSIFLKTRMNTELSNCVSKMQDRNKKKKFILHKKNLMQKLLKEKQNWVEKYRDKLSKKIKLMLKDKRDFNN